MSIEVVGVIGAGIMGVGVAQNLAQTGHHVILLDICDDILENALQQIRQNVRFSRLFNKTASQESIEEVMARITTTTTYEPLQKADFVVENVVEKWDVKKEIYPQLDQVCPDHCVFAANTSCISITKIGSVTNRPDRIIGMHFMNPVPMKPTVEVIRGFRTTEQTVDMARLFLEGMGKNGIVVNDMPGFVTNRILMLTINEAAYVVQDQVAEPSQVDEIFRSCFGHPMGPLETGDLIGLDTILYSIEVLYESYNDSKYRPCPLLKKMVDAGLLGRKSGAGFYEYP
ncbi:MAG: 3-hydroxybutyryl-CoA dehydrogenase [Chloroflexi bacterium]|nr:3-hydroxybutyryl-CoA dehydrogenase [Chloroflexota bacterium]